MNTTTDLKKIMDALHIEALAPEEQEEILLDLNSLIFKGSLVRLVEKMDDDTREEFNAFVETDPSEEQMDAFLKEKVPGTDEAVKEAIEDLASDILAVTKE